MVLDILVAILCDPITWIILSAALVAGVFEALFEPRLYSGFPVVGLDPRKGYVWAQKQWTENTRGVIRRGLEECDGCFQVCTDSGPKIVLPSRFADEIRDHPDLSLRRATAVEFSASYSGFQAFSERTSGVVVKVVKKRLSRSLGAIARDLAQETSSAIATVFGEPEGWTEVECQSRIEDLITRISSRIFVGEQLSTNDEWLRLSREYSTIATSAAHSLRGWHPWFRPVVHWFLPECRKLRATLHEAHDILTPVIRKRRAHGDTAPDEERCTSTNRDVVDWLDEAARGESYDAVAALLRLSHEAIHKTADVVSGVIHDLCGHPEYFESLRNEIGSVLGEKKWSVRSLDDLKLMDTVLMESQRRHGNDISKPFNFQHIVARDGYILTSAAMHRIAGKAIDLSDGARIPAGASTVVAAAPHRHGLEMFSKPETLKDSALGKDVKDQNFTATSPRYLVFGHGRHACPGRFFAAAQIKIVLVGLLIGYEWRSVEAGEDGKDGPLGQVPAKLEIKKRVDGS
ncbi:cytochrome P450 [Aspergillus karnatakaensis]|uniref:cytochrome P450 n=1 Tax=Aspergillus karnatakaensis TaxID=1810916 RepID=UPI003CCD3615